MAMREIILDGAVVADSWTHLGDDEAVPALDPIRDGATPLGPRVIVSLERWRGDAALQARPQTGVRVSSHVDPRTLGDVAARAALIALHFPKFGDGRAYSQARVLREQLGYDGHLRAWGDVLRDQAFYMQRCGFDVLEIAPDRRADDVAKGLSDFSVVYQAAADEPLPVYHRGARAKAAGAA